MKESYFYLIGMYKIVSDFNLFIMILSEFNFIFSQENQIDYPMQADVVEPVFVENAADNLLDDDGEEEGHNSESEDSLDLDPNEDVFFDEELEECEFFFKL